MVRMAGGDFQPECQQAGLMLFVMAADSSGLSEVRRCCLIWMPEVSDEVAGKAM